MARTLTSRQQEALEALDRSTHVRVRVEDGDGVMVDVRDFEGYDLFSHATVRASVEEPISAAELHLWREADPGDGGPLYSLAPLIEQSLFNKNAAGSYDPVLGLVRRVEIDIATMLQGEQPDSGDYEPLWEGYIDDIEWGGLPSRATLYCRDPIALLNDTIIEDVTTYGGGSPLAPIQDVMQQILDDNMGSGEFELWVEGDPDFGIEEYELGHVSVLAALKALADLIGWNLHWRWQESPGEFRLTLYEPIRDRASLSGFAPDWTFGPSGYYDLPGVRLAIGGVRTAGEVFYIDQDGAEQVYAETRSGPEAEFRRRFLRLDERKARQIRSEAQAQTYLGSILDDLSVPPLLQKVDAAIHWPIELCDVHEYEANDVHYDTAQTLAVFGYQHLIQPNRVRTLIDTSGQPSGGFRRWLAKEVLDPPASDTVERLLDQDTTTRSHTGDTNDTVVGSVQVPALWPFSKLRVRLVWAFTGTAGTKQLKARFDDGTVTGTVALYVVPAADTGYLEMNFVVEVTGQNASRSSWPVQGAETTLRWTPTNDMTIPNDLDFMIDLGNAGDTAALISSEVYVLEPAA